MGAQVLLSFQFQAFFQDGFSELGTTSQYLCWAGLILVLLSVTLLVIPSMEHRLEMGRSSRRLIFATSVLTGLGLVPLALSLALGVSVVVSRHWGIFGRRCGRRLGHRRALAWFDVENLIEGRSEATVMQQSLTPLGTMIEQLLMEARAHGSARLYSGRAGVAGVSNAGDVDVGFDRLPHTSKAVHLTALIVRTLKQLANGNTPTGVMSIELQRPVAAIRSTAQREGVSLKPVNRSPYNRRTKSAKGR